MDTAFGLNPPCYDLIMMLLGLGPEFLKTKGIARRTSSIPFTVNVPSSSAKTVID